MRSAKLWLVILTTLSPIGCVDRTPPPPNAEIPRTQGGPYRSNDPVKPMPGPDENYQAGGLPPPPFYDVPIVSQDTPEQRAFVDAYNAVGRPRIVVFVNRTLEGALLPVTAAPPSNRSEQTVESRDRSQDSGDPFDDRERSDTYLRPDQYDPATAEQIDYEAMETILTDWLAAGGKTEIVSPVTVRQRLTDDQVRDLQSGRPRMTGEIARELDADVLVQVSARPTRQTPRGLEIRLVAEAINVGRGGQSIGRAVVDVPPPLDKPRINKFTRFLARVLMDRMIGTWENMPARAAGEAGGARQAVPEVPPPADTRPNPGSPLLEPPDAPPPPAKDQ